MNIAIITPGVLPVPSVKGGAVETLIDYLIEFNEITLDHEITIYGIDDICLSHNNLHCYKNVNFNLINQRSLIYRLKRKIYSLLYKDCYYNFYLDYFIKIVSKKIANENFDIVVIENRPGFIMSLVHKTNAKIILHLHNDLLNKDTKDAKKILEYCKCVFTVSKYIKNRVDTIMPNNKVQVVYNGIDFEKFNNPPILKISRTNFHLSEDDFVVVYTGRIEPVKGVKELLEAFSLLSDYKKIKLLIVGGGNGNVNEGRFFSEMHKLASSMPGKVIFTGFQSYENIPSILNLSNIAVVPSIWEEPLSLTSLEHIAAGLPLVVTKSGGIPEIVDEKCAIVIENDTCLVDNLAKSILVLFNDQSMRSEMSKHAKERSALFSKESYCESFFQKISEL